MNFNKLRNPGIKVEFDSVIQRPSGLHDGNYYIQDHCMVTLRVYNRSIFPLKDEICYTLGKYSGGCLYPEASEPVKINLRGKIPFLKSSDSKSEWFPLEIVTFTSDNEQIIIHVRIGYFVRSFKYKFPQTDQTIEDPDKWYSIEQLVSAPNIEDVEASFRSVF